MAYFTCIKLHMYFIYVLHLAHKTAIESFLYVKLKSYGIDDETDSKTFDTAYVIHEFYKVHVKYAIVLVG